MSEKFETAKATLHRTEFDAFAYLRTTNDLLSNPYYEVLGRELVIRALDARSKFSNQSEILKAMVRKAGLYPYLSSEFENISVEDEYAISIYRSAHSPEFIYHSMQLKILKLLYEGRNVVLSAPTSMGKSAIVDSLIASGNYRRIVIVVPTIALIDETRRRIAQKFSAHYDVISHNSQATRNTRKTVFILTQERANERSDMKSIDLFVIDEFYKLAFKKDQTDERTVALNICLSKLLLASKQFYMIGPSVDDVRGLNEFGKNYVFIPSTFNTVAVNVTEYNLSANDRAAKISTLLKILQPHESGAAGQTIIYCRSPQSAAEIVEDLIENNIGTPTRSDYTDWVDKHYSAAWAYSRAVRAGIGIHHGALPRAIQQYTIDLFNEKALKILICTATIIEGVNTNAETVVVFDNRSGTGSIDRFTHNNIKGRAGRMNVHFVGNVHCLERTPGETIQGQVVDIPLGLQSSSSPPNLLAGIEAEHVQEAAAGTLRDYLASSHVPPWVLKKHATYRVETLRALLEHVSNLSTYELREACSKRPSAAQIELMCTALRVAEFRSLQHLNLHSQESDLKLKFSRYLFAESYQGYLDSIIAWIELNNTNDVMRSKALDRDLKIIRNIFGFAVPRALSLLQDLMNHVINERRLDFSANFEFVRAQFENNHLPGVFSALEEMGIPVQTLAKIKDERLTNIELNILVRYLRIHYRTIKNLTNLDRKFIGRALN
jgi:superfamily II DNA/RNA helicase